MFPKSLLCLFALAAVLTAQSAPPTQQTPRGRGGATATDDANEEANASANGGRGQTMKQLARGTLFAAASMSPQATLTAEHMLRDGGNAFDAIVAGQAVLGLVQPNLNGMGSDATLLIYDAKAQEGLVAECRRHGAQTRHHRVVQDQPGREDSGQRFAALRHRSGRDGRLVHPAFPLGHQDASANVLAPAIETGRARRAHRRPRAELRRRCASIRPACKLYRAARRHSAGRMAKSGRIPTWRAPCADWWRPRNRRPIRAVWPDSRRRATASIRAISRARWRNSPRRTAACSATKISPLHRQAGRAGIDQLSRLHGLQERFGQPGTGRTVRAEHAGRLRPEEDGPKFRRLHPHLRGGHEAGHGRPRQLPWRHGFHPDSLRGLLSKEYAAERGAS